MKQSWRILVLQALCAFAAKTSSWRTPLAVSETSAGEDNSERVFHILRQKTCTEDSYTKNLADSCDGWEGLTEEQCEQKCATNAQAPNCPQETCHAAVFNPASGACHLYANCKALGPSIGSVTLIDEEMLAEEEVTRQNQVLEVGPLTDLVTAMPIMLLNLTKYSTLLRNGDSSIGVTHAFGNITADREMLFDKVHGFFLALRERMTAESREKYCPFPNEAVIAECVTIATCILQRAVPNEVSMETFASITEQVSRFDEITWPLLRTFLIAEGDEDEDNTLPDELRCDGAQNADPHSLAATAFLQREARAAESLGHAETLAMSSSLQRATASTHRILDAHGMNSSMHATGKQLEELWRPICQKLPCDSSNMHDVFVASHKQSMALFQTRAVGHLHLEIRQRVKLDLRLQRFVADHHAENVAFFHEKILSTSLEAAQLYGMRGRKAVMDTILPFMEDMTNIDPERALRLVDHVEFAKYVRALEQKTEPSQKHQIMKLEHGHLRIEDVPPMSDQDEDDLEDELQQIELAGEEASEHKQGRSLVSLDHNGTGKDVSPHWCVGKTVALWNHAHQHYARMSDHRVERGAKGWREWNDMPYSWTWERFVCVDVGNGEVAFHNTQWNRFIRMHSNGKIDRSSECSRDFIPGGWSWERFKLKDVGNGEVGIWSPHWKKFMQMQHGSELKSKSRSSIDDFPSWMTWEKFRIQEVVKASSISYWFCARTVILWNEAHRKYVQMDKKHKIKRKSSKWKDPFPSGWEWERWVPVMAGHNEVAFHSTKWNRFLRMNSNGKMDASHERNIHDLVDWMTWERFRVVQLGGKIALYNTHHKKFVQMSHGNELSSLGPMEYWDLPDHWTWEQFVIKEVGEASHCNFWCKLASPFVKVFKAVVSFVAKLLECFGQFAVTATGGYGRPISTNVAVNFGVSGKEIADSGTKRHQRAHPATASVTQVAVLVAAAGAGVVVVEVEAIALDFPALPDSCLALCSSLSGEMDFDSLVAAESGSVEIEEFSWPVLSPDQASYQCLAYCIMKRPSGFLLCVPEGFLPQEELDRGQAATEVDGIGPSFAAPALVVSPTGVASQLAPADFAAPSLYTFKDDNPAVFPRATDIIRQARDWIATVDVLAHDRSGYQTATSTAEPAPGPKDKARAPKRPAVQQLATQQAKMMDLLSAVVSRLDSRSQPRLPKSRGPCRPKPRGSEEPCCRAGPPPPSQRCIGIGEALVALVSQLSGSSAVGYMRYLERHGAFGGQPLLGLLAWQLAQALDLLQANSQDGARDVLSLMLLMLDQSCAGRRGLRVAARLSEVVTFLHSAGLSPGSYDTGAVPEIGARVSHDTSGPEALQPYGPIVAERVVLHGKGQWDLARHLEPDLCMAFVEPEVLRFPGTGAPCASFAAEDKGELLRLCRIWDASGLLSLAPGPLPDRALTRIFGAFKSSGRQRQIGDRRGQNSWEARLCGPSRFLPTGALLARLHVPKGFCLSGCVTDRRDFYTQACVSFERSRTNAVGPCFQLSDFRGLSAHLDFCNKAAGLKIKLGPCCKAMLEEWSSQRLQSKHRVAAQGPWSGHIIDDFFSLSVEASDFVPGGPSASLGLLHRAKAAYTREAVLGSDEKDVLAQRVLKVAGAEIDTDPATTSDGLALVGYPVAKRLALSVCLMSVLDRVFAVSRGEPADSTLSPDVPLASFSCLPCSPLLSAATLAPTRVSESSPPTPPTPTGPCVQRVSALRFLWTFGWHLISAVLRCTSPPFLVEKVPGDDPAVSADAGPPPTVDAYEQLDPSDPGASPPAPAKPWAFDYDFLEVGTSGGFVARQLAAGNFCVGPLVDRRCSRQYDLGASPLRDWLVHLVSESKALRARVGMSQARAVAAVVRDCARREGDTKVTILADSSVARGAVAKGRSSSHQLLLLRCFDATLGYPGEGPLQPRHAKDEGRQRERARSTLPEGRPILQRTTANREHLVKNLEAWLRGRGVSVELFWTASAEQVANLLSVYGRELFDAGFPYWHYAETIHSVSGRFHPDFAEASGRSVGKARHRGRGLQASLENIMSGKPPPTSISLSAGAGAGKTTKWFWLGVGVSLSVSCTAADTFGCKFGISVGAIATGWSEKQTDEKCPFGPTLTGFKCKRSECEIPADSCARFQHMVSRLLDYSEGGPNDPRTTFNDLRKWLTAVKEEISPWGWQAYDAEFRERMQAEKKLYAMNGLPNSGAEPQDGVIQGTPLWQERLDQMLLVEHLKRKVMVAHTAFTEATDLLLKSHAWLVKDSLLADKFAECISRVPPSQHDRIDLLQVLVEVAWVQIMMARILCHGVDSPVWASCATKPRTLQGAETRVALVDVRGITKDEAVAAEPKDAVLASLKSMDHQFEQDREAMEKDIRAHRKAAYDDGRGSELPSEERVPTPAEIAHQLMQAGDYGNGPPYPIEGAPAPPWRRQGVEGTDNVTVQTDHTVLGKGRSTELIRCFDGEGVEQQCGQLYKTDVNAVKEEDDNLLSGLGYGGPLTSGRTACTLQSAVALLRPSRTAAAPRQRWRAFL
ncbi:hypothetical protein AK812_SmicGene21737 [Symbiodinium microadriaticum]|uniref:Uncharacterized protein n=1 Tax=Symbiodinium microadriaticum TaxID=2951 RepID=A0A1Q9DLM2_SYMMI|nr:hypothetical protein AK812_SmicGene21737 [Symbiodinium microadriaticum]